MQARALSALLLAVASAFPYIPGPPSQAAQPAWLAQLYANRTAQRAAVNYTGAVYDNYLLWSPSLHIVPQSHLYDRFLYDPSKGLTDPAQGWTVDRFLDDLTRATVVWTAYSSGTRACRAALSPAQAARRPPPRSRPSRSPHPYHHPPCSYPNLGVDERSQFDLVEDVPGGLAALKAVVAQFNARGVRVGIPYNPCAFPSRPPPSRPSPVARPHCNPLRTPPLQWRATTLPQGTLGRPGATRPTRPCSPS